MPTEAGVVRPALHEIRNALFGMTSLIQLLADEEVVREDAELGQLCRRALFEGSRVTALVADLATLARPIAPQFRAVDCAAVLENVRRVSARDLPPLEDGRTALLAVVVRGLGRVESDEALLRAALNGLVRLVWRSIRGSASVAPGGAAPIDPRVRIELRQAADGVTLDVVPGGTPEPGDWTAPLPVGSADGTALVLAAIERRVDAIGATLQARKVQDGEVAWRVAVPRRRG